MIDAPLTYSRDDARHRITVTITGPATLDDMMRIVERQAADGTWRYAMLYDQRTTAISASAGELRAFLAAVDRLTRAHGPRGPVAMVCLTDEQFGMARMYSTLGEHQGLDSEAFRDFAAAEAWLDRRQERTSL
jgi:hypothetical protein